MWLLYGFAIIPNLIIMGVLLLEVSGVFTTQKQNVINPLLTPPSKEIQ
jgi:membrane-anchored glycerophosphoryl diester phosphodiesterase (GDPDase)